MNKIFRFVLIPTMVILVIAFSCSNNSSVSSKTDTLGISESSDQKPTDVKTEVEYLTTEEFKKEIFDYTKEKEWNYKGNVPCVIDFYADWCGPCKRVAPIMDELSVHYKGKIKFYKVNTDKERELASAFGITGIPSVLFVPMKGQPQMTSGAYPKDEYMKIIEKSIFGKK